MDTEPARELHRRVDFPADIDAMTEGQLLYGGKLIEMGIVQLQQAYPVGSDMHIVSETHPTCSTHRVMKPPGPESYARMYRYEDWTRFAAHALGKMLIDGLLILDDEDAEQAARGLVEKLGEIVYDDPAAFRWVPIDASDPSWLTGVTP